jgi:hypothetical protein
MARLTIRLAVAASVGLCAASCAVWAGEGAGGHWVLSLEAPPRLFEVRPAEGRLEVAITRGWPGMDRLGFSHYPVVSGPGQVHAFAGVRAFDAPTQLMQIYSPTAQSLGMISGGDTIIRPPKPNPMSTLTVAVPLWELSLLAAVPVLAAGAAKLWAAWRRRRTRPGHCPRCGYDLRATPEGGGALLGRCPECGTASVP